MTTAYDEGHQAFCNNIDADENPHYTAFGDLDQDYYDWNRGWNRGWNDAEDAWYRKMDDDESAHWQECLSEEE